MVAAYVIGFSITADDLKINPALKFAEGEYDTGVIVSWNTEGPEIKMRKMEWFLKMPFPSIP